MKNLIKQAILVVAFFILSTNINAQQIHGTVKLASDGITPVENAQIKIWHKYTTGSAGDTLHLTTDANGIYYFPEFKINGDPDTITTDISDFNNNTEMYITNNPGQEHTFVFSSKSKAKGAGEIYNIKGEKIANVEAIYENGKIISSWNGETNKGLALEGIYIFSQVLENGERITNKFIQLNNGTKSNNSIEKNINKPKNNAVNKTVAELDQATYIFDLVSITGTTNPIFIHQIDTIIFAPINLVTDFYANHLVDGIPNHRDVSVVIREPYDSDPLENVLVKIRDESSGNIIDSTYTDVNGIATINNVPLGTTFTWEYGNDTTINNRADYFSRNNELDSIIGLNLVFSDTVETITREKKLPPKLANIPSLSLNYNGSIPLTAEWISEFVGDVDIEVAMGRGKRISMPNLSGAYVGINEYLIEADTLLNGADVNDLYIVTEANAILVSPSMIANYDENSNYHPDSLGIRIEMGSPNDTYENAQLNNNLNGIISGTHITSTTGSSPLWEQIFGEGAGLPTTLPSGRVSFINSPTNITQEDKALYKLRTLNAKAVYLYENDNQDYSNVIENL